jgi:hypothetical protein
VIRDWRTEANHHVQGEYAPFAYPSDDASHTAFISSSGQNSLQMLGKHGRRNGDRVVKMVIQSCKG